MIRNWYVYTLPVWWPIWPWGFADKAQTLPRAKFENYSIIQTHILGIEFGMYIYKGF